MKTQPHLLLALALPAALAISGKTLAACDQGNAVEGFSCNPAGPVAVGAVFANSASDARRNVSLALVSELLEEEGEDAGSGSGDGPPIDLFATLVYGDKDYETVSVPGFNSNRWGGVVGVDYRAPEYVVGAALDYSQEDANFDNNAGSQDTDELGFQLFANYTPASVRGLFFSAAARYSSLDIDTTRTFLTAVGAQTDNKLNQASGSTDGSTFGLLGGAGYSWPLQRNTSLDVSAWLSWQDYKIDGYQENGAAPQGNGLVVETQSGNLRFEDDNYSTLDGILTAELTHSIPISNGVLTPRVSASYIHEFESDTRTINAVLVDVPNTEFRDVRFRTNEADRNYFRLGASLTAAFNGGTTVYLNYSGMVGHDWRNENLVMLGLNQAF